jgi:cardiolipin synthase C
MHKNMKIKTIPMFRWNPKLLLTHLAAPFMLISGCATLPTDLERPQSHVISDTSHTHLGLIASTLANNHPGKSGFHALEEGINAFAARVALTQSAEKTLYVQYYIWHPV